MSETLHTWSIYIYNAYFLLFTTLLDKLWFPVVLGSWLVVLRFGLREERRARLQPVASYRAAGGEVYDPGYNPADLRRRRR